MAKTYSLNDLGVTADDLILLDAAGYRFDETDNISEEKREEILSLLYNLKRKNKENAPEEVPAVDYAAGVEAATPEQAKQMKYELKNGQQLDLQDVASLVKSEQIVSKDVRAEMKRVIVEAANADKLDKSDVAALGYLLDEINGKHASERGNAHSVHEYRKQFDDNPEILNAAARKLETGNVYNREDLETILHQGEIYLAKPEEIQENMDARMHDNHQRLFAEHVHDVETLIKNYAEGRVSIEPDAMESMEKLLDTYGKEWVRGTGVKEKFKNGVSYDITQDACNAQQRLAAERKEYREGFDDANSQRSEKVEEQALDVEEKTEERKGPSKEELDAAKKKKPKDRTLRDWIVLKEGIENNPKLSDGQKEYELKSLTSQARTHKMINPKSVSDEELKDVDQFMKAFGYDVDKKGRAATNPIAMRWRDAIKKRQAALANSEEKDVFEPVEPIEETGEEQKKVDEGNDKSDDKGDDKGHGVVAPIVIPGERHITNDKEVRDWEENKPAEQQKEDENKKKKGLFGKVGDWAKRNWKKIAIGGAILAASLFGAKQCSGNQGQDDKGKDKIEVVTPTPDKKQKQQNPDDKVIDWTSSNAQLKYGQRAEHHDGKETTTDSIARARAKIDLRSFSGNTKEAKEMMFGKGATEKYKDSEMLMMLKTATQYYKGDKELCGIIDDAIHGKCNDTEQLKKIQDKVAANFDAKDDVVTYRPGSEVAKQSGTLTSENNHDEHGKRNSSNLSRIVDNARGNQGM